MDSIALRVRLQWGELRRRKAQFESQPGANQRCVGCNGSLLRAKVGAFPGALRALVRRSVIPRNISRLRNDIAVHLICDERRT